MISAEIQCTYCGWKGMTGRKNQKSDGSDELTFKRLGRNPLSGHFHYQCPACSVVLLVPPMDILKAHFHRGIPHAGTYGLAACQ
jgi:hypothetical protein